MEIWNDSYHNLIDAIPKGVQVINRQGVLVDANRAWLIYFGVSLEFVRGRPLSEVMQDMIFANPAAIDKSLPETEYTSPAALETLKTGLPYSRTFNKDRMLAVARPIYHRSGHFNYVITTISENVNVALAESSPVPLASPNEKRPHPQSVMVGESSTLGELRRAIQQVAPTEASVLICGETGTGKELVAQELHKLSGRDKDTFIRVNCAAIPENLLESELFGYERGAFTGAASTGKSGLIEAADGGTLFLDEINALPLAQQGKLLRVLESRAVQRIGSVKEKPVNFRLIAATNMDLRRLVAERSFRADLYYRLNVIQLRVAPLRERPADIHTIFNHYLALFGSQYGKTVRLSPDAWEQLLSYRWPGNVRELRNLAESLTVTSSQYEVTPAVLNAHYLNSGLVEYENSVSDATPSLEKRMQPNFDDDFSLRDYLDQCERDLLAEAYRQYGSNRKVADLLKIDQSSVARKRAKYGL